MKKLIESNLGILFISVLPTIISYITFAKDLSLSRTIIMEHLPFILSILCFCIISGVLFIRKAIIDKFNGIEMLLNEKIKTSSDITDFALAKHQEQLNIFSESLHKIEGKPIKKALLTESENVLMKALSDYESERLKHIYKILGRNFDETGK